MLQLADLHFDPTSGTVTRDGEELALSRLNYDLLRVLIDRAPALVSIEQLLDDVWPGVVVNEETVRQRVKLLRKALGDDPANPKYIEVVRGRGYRLVPEVTEAQADRVQASRSRSRMMLIVMSVVVLTIVGYLLANRGTESLSESSEVKNIPDVEAAVNQRVRLAVLPFSQSEQAESTNQWFADGMHDELLTRLSGISGLQVRPRSSSMNFRNSTLSAAEIAAFLDVDWLIDGTVRRLDDSIRVNVRLIDPAANETSWANTYDNNLSVNSVFDIQSDIAIKVADEIRVELSAEERARIVLRDTQSLPAYDAQLLGRFHVFRGTEEDIRIAISQFGRATQLDPGYARAWEGLGWAHVMSGLTLGWRQPRESLDDAMSATETGLALAPENVELLNLQASIRLFRDRDIDRALDVFSRLALAPNPSPSVLINLAFTRSLRKEFEQAAIVIGRMVEMFPFDAPVFVQAAYMSRAANNPEATISYAKQALEYDPEMSDARLALAWGQFDSAEYEGALQMFIELDVISGRIMSLARLDRPEEARQLLAKLNTIASGHYVHPYIFALAYIGLGENEAARRAVNTAIEHGGRESLWMTIDPQVTSWAVDQGYEFSAERSP